MIVVIGGSYGGAEALRRIARDLPAGWRLPLAVVLHRHRDSAGLLAPVLQRACALPVCEVEDQMAIEPGRIHLAPSDYHLLLNGDRFSLSTDEPVNFARPSVDVLFESAAEWRDGGVIAVILSGLGVDGAAGARGIEQAGGRVLVQDPRTAEASGMPAAAIEKTRAAEVLTIDRIAARLIELSRTQGGST